MNQTIPSLLRAAARRYGDKAALISDRNERTSFAKIDAEADRVARALLADGVHLGDRLAIWAPNMWEWVAAAVGLQRVGGTLVPLNARYRGVEVADIVRRAGVTHLIMAGKVGSAYFPDLLRDEDTPSLRRRIVFDIDSAKANGRDIAWGRFLQRGEDVSDAALGERETMVTPDTISDIMFTSGTTGRPKGAVFDHRTAIRGAENMIGYPSISEQDVFCPMGPFAHLGGYKTGWLVGLLAGATVCWGDTRDGKATLDLISSRRITIMPAPPVTWQDLLDSPNRADWDVSCLRFVATGGTVVPPHIVRRLRAELNVQQVGTGYGMTETTGITNYSRPEDSPEQVALTVGRPAPDSEVRIVDAEGRVLPADGTGEIVVRNDRLLIKYLDDPVATRAALEPDGWLHTGDVGCMDEEGYLRITDRLKDMYISNGFNVYPAELERLLMTMPGVKDCAVIGIPDARRGEAGHLFLVRGAGSTTTEAEAIGWCKQTFANYKVPELVTFVDELPRNALGKVLKNQLRNLQDKHA